MPQGEVIEVLEQARKPLSAGEIIKRIKEKDPGRNEKRIFVLLSTLVKFKEVKTKEIDRHTAREKYNEKVNRRLKLYYV